VDGGGGITQKGIYFSMSANPATTGTRFAIAGDTPDYSFTLSGIAANTTFYLRAYAIDSDGESVGEEISFHFG
jgi:hypothetical protein